MLVFDGLFMYAMKNFLYLINQVLPNLFVEDYTDTWLIDFLVQMEIIVFVIEQ